MSRSSSLDFIDFDRRRGVVDLWCNGKPVYQYQQLAIPAAQTQLCGVDVGYDSSYGCINTGPLRTIGSIARRAHAELWCGYVELQSSTPLVCPPTDRVLCQGAMHGVVCCTALCMVVFAAFFSCDLIFPTGHYSACLWVVHKGMPFISVRLLLSCN